MAHAIVTAHQIFFASKFSIEKTLVHADEHALDIFMLPLKVAFAENFKLTVLALASPTKWIVPISFSKVHQSISTFFTSSWTELASWICILDLKVPQLILRVLHASWRHSLVLLKIPQLIVNFHY